MLCENKLFDQKIPERFHHVGQIFMQVGMGHDSLGPNCQLILAGQFTIN